MTKTSQWQATLYGENLDKFIDVKTKYPPPPLLLLLCISGINLNILECVLTFAKLLDVHCSSIRLKLASRR